MNPTFFLSCLESRIEDNTSWYSKFEIGPFPTGQALTVANSLRRTLLAQKQGVFIIGVEIEGAIHEYSRLKGLEESVLDILLNLRQLSLIAPAALQEKHETLIGYFDIQGPALITAKDLQFPQGIECVNTDQVIATLSRDGSFRGRFLISLQSKTMPVLGDPVKIGDHLLLENSDKNFSKVQWLALNPIINPVRRVNYSVEQFKNVWEKQEVAILELWTNGSIHPRQALQQAITNLAQLFFTIGWINGSSLKAISANQRFSAIKKNSSSISETQLLKTLGLTNQKSIKSNSNESFLLNNEEMASDRVSALLDLDIANLNLSLQTFLYLKNVGIENLGNLLQQIKLNFNKVPNLSSQQKEEIQTSLTDFGF